MIGIVLLIIVVALARVSRGTVLGKLLGGLSIVMVWLGIVVFLLWATLLNPYVGMTSTGFTDTYVSIFSHDKVTFENPADELTQILCVGLDHQCEKLSLSGYPSQFTPGLVIQPGQSVSIGFEEDGTYYITSKNTPHMNLKVIVTGFNRKGGD